MKNKLLAAMALCCATSSTMPLWAGNWEQPTVQITPFDQLGDTCYVYHPVTKTFLTQGNGYGTQASLADTGLKTVIKEGNDPVLADISGNLIEFPKATGNNGGKPFYLFIASQSDAYVDHREQGHCCWKITKNETGDYYRIKIVDNDPNYGIDAGFPDCYLGWSSTDDVPFEGVMNNTIVRPLLNKEQQGTTTAELDWAFVTPESYDVYQAKKTLLSALEYSEEKNYTGDLTEVEKVYNESTDIETILATADKLIQDVNEEFYADVNADNPMSMTELIKNANFPDGDMSGWTNNGMAMSRTAETDRYYNADGEEMFRFVEAWVASDGGNGKLKDLSVMQTLTLPNGKYILEADVIGIQQGNTAIGFEGVYLVANAGENEVRANAITVAYEDDDRVKANHINMEFYIENGKSTIGFRTESTNCNWVGVDNFQLTYYGKVESVVRDELRTTLKKAQDFHENVINEGYNYNKEGEASLLEAVSAAEKALSAGGLTDDELKAVTKTLSDEYTKFEANVKAYQDFETLLNQGMDVRFSYPAYGTLEFPKLDAYYGEISEKFDQGSWDPNEAATLVAKLDTLFREDLHTLLAEGTVTDLYGLIYNPDFNTNKKDGWTFETSGNNVLFNIGYEAGEVYVNAGNRTFDLYQELKDIPNGAYEITLVGYNRPLWQGQTSIDLPSLVDVYGNDMKESLTHIYDPKQETPVVPTSDGGFEDKEITELGIYAPDNMKVARAYFDAGIYPTIKLTCVVTDGTLRWGVRSNTTTNQGCWAIFDSFTLNYKGNTAADYVPTVQAVLEDVVAASTNQSTLNTQDALDKLEDAIRVGSAALQATTVDECLAAIEQMKAALQYNDSSIVAIEKFGEVVTALSIRVEEKVEFESYPGADKFHEVYDKIVDEYFNAVNGDIVLASIDLVNQYIVDLQNAVTAVVMSVDLTGASETSPVDVTGVISNPRFETEENEVLTDNIDHWTNPGSKTYYSVEFYNTNFDMSQVLRGLKKGYYELRFNGFYRNGDFLPASGLYRDGLETINAFAYAGEGAEERVTPLASIFSDRRDEKLFDSDVDVSDSLTIEGSETGGVYIPNYPEGAQKYFLYGVDRIGDGKYEGDGLYLNKLQFEVKNDGDDVKIGVKKVIAKTNDWTLVDNFRLYYIGLDQPDAIGNVEDGTATVVDSAYFTIGGAQIAKPTQRGFYIREDRMSDGTTRSVKFMVK